jgi:hypothetical protein
VSDSWLARLKGLVLHVLRGLCGTYEEMLTFDVRRRKPIQKTEEWEAFRL